ncbi:hypothetical protein C2845_PM12G13060 [Panicum miliaceum]|uniref:Uncharacterized protein n=1 Tax=Panicum miliaceum TaxID=4540 RepID=A0A3L6QDC0_PANMI|nr:hypothetical protein C2845_PM12G13060 [Panicum miliaceum]
MQRRRPTTSNLMRYSNKGDEVSSASPPKRQTLLVLIFLLSFPVQTTAAAKRLPAGGDGDGNGNGDGGGTHAGLD